ncbi:CAP domain-containing protein [uncultured Kocuria sp.]|uniref:CAP domain-containing protein n=1 Tax=uncultured Kocuria sp. TaxID=259305 RepID=UPI002638A81B|nr:CAP domain-containing protein [uncultured Kocuria sp.]
MSHAKHRATARTRTPGPLTLTAAALALAVPATGMLTAAPAAAASSDIVTVSSSTRSADAQQLLELINAHRKAKGLAPVKYSASVSGIAQGESDRLVRQEVINHTNTFMTDPRAAGWHHVGEIHAVSYQGRVADLMTWWKGSKDHNKVLTEPDMTVIGIGLTYADGSLAETKQGWRLVGTVTSYGYPDGKGPTDVRTTVGTAPAPAPAPKPTPPPTTAPITSAGYEVRGGIGRQYHALGGASVFGAPTGNERGGLLYGGVLQGFAKKHTFYWSAGTGAWPVNFNGAIGRKFAAHRWENGFGYPTTREITGLTGGGAYQVFRKGNAVHKVLWSPRTGAKVVKESGAIGQRWKSAGAERGYGYPVTDEYRYGSEVRQRFSNGYTVHWSSITKRNWVTR